MKEIITVQQPFEAVTTELSAEKYVSASKILPLARGLQKVTITNKSNGNCFHLCEKLMSQMKSRFANMEDKGVVAVSTLLDPRFKKIPFASESSIEKMSRQIIGDAAALANNEQQPTTPPTDSATQIATTSAVWEYFDSQVTASVTDRRPNILALSELGPSERLFSELISLKRNRLKPKNVNMLLFLNKTT